MDPISAWLLAYLLPAGATFLVWFAVRDRSSILKVGVVHLGLLVSILALTSIGVRLYVSFDLLALILILTAILLSFLLINAFGLAYTLSSVIQEWCLLLAGVLLIPTTGVFLAAFLTSLVYALAHLLNLSGWRWKVPLMLLWGMFSIFLYVWLEQPLLNIALHIVGGSVLLHRRLLLTGGRL